MNELELAMLGIHGILIRILGMDLSFVIQQ